jgi:putative tryptophan/tyrosine transport system substrate-binding protein
MRRRAFIAIEALAFAAALVLRPVEAPAQQPSLPVIGFLSSASAEPLRAQLAAFLGALKELGYQEDQNVRIEYRWADDRYDRLPALAAELVRLQPAVIVASGGPAPALAAKAATTSIPIVFTASSDPVESGLVERMSQPGGNVTGIGALTSELDAKRLELLHELAPAAAAIGMLINPNRPNADGQQRDAQAAARALGRELVILRAGAAPELDAAFATIAAKRIGGLLIGADPFFNSQRVLLVGLVTRHAVPTVYPWREFIGEGGFISFGPNLAEAYRAAGGYVGKILKGAKPASLPVLQPTKFELVINLKTAKALGLTVPPALLARADEVIE